MNQKKRNFLTIFFASLTALCIPGILILNAYHSSKYKDLLKEVTELEEKQEALVEENKQLITDISLLSGTERIENIAENQLGMRQAESDEIIRVEMNEEDGKKSFDVK